MLSFGEWFRWFRSLPWSVKWFVLLVLLRPLIDGFYTLKRISPFVSPLYIVGILTPILTLVAVLKLPAPKRSKLDTWFKAWGLLIAISLLFLFFRDATSIRFLQYLFKLTMPLYLFAFLRYFVRSERELNGLLQAFLYSTLIVAGVFLFEVFMGPIRVEESRGFTRIQGFFGDVVNYGIYLTQGFLVTAYFHLRRPSGESELKSFIRLGVAVFLATALLLNIHHTATLGVFATLLLLFLYFERQRRPGLIAFLSILIIAGSLYVGRSFLQENVIPLIEEEIEVLQGDAQAGKLLHGRVSRWQSMWGRFTEEGPWAVFFGYPLGKGYPYQMISAGAHNDYIRILFMSGLFGLIVYLGILQQWLRRLKGLTRAHRFLATGGLLIIVLFSLTTTPTMYPPMLYVLYSIFAFIALPQRPQNAPSPDPDTRKKAPTVHGALSDDRDHPELLS
ncbi:MAG: O-antigen ligase family protein [Flavobacteriales bacterium]